MICLDISQSSDISKIFRKWIYRTLIGYNPLTSVWKQIYSMRIYMKKIYFFLIYFLLKYLFEVISFFDYIFFGYTFCLLYLFSNIFLFGYNSVCLQKVNVQISGNSAKKRKVSKLIITSKHAQSARFSIPILHCFYIVFFKNLGCLYTAFTSLIHCF